MFSQPLFMLYLAQHTNQAMRMLSMVQMKKSFKNHIQKCLVELFSSVEFSFVSSYEFSFGVENVQAL